MQPQETSTDPVAASAAAQLQRFADTESNTRLAIYQAALRDWKLNAPIFVSLKKSGPPKPTPPVVAIVNPTADGPAIIDGTALVCEPEPPPPPAVPIDATPRLGIALGGGFYSAGTGDEAPDGFILEPIGPGGPRFEKHVAVTPFGTRNWYTLEAA